MEGPGATSQPRGVTWYHLCLCLGAESVKLVCLICFFPFLLGFVFFFLFHSAASFISLGLLEAGSTAPNAV